MNKTANFFFLIGCFFMASFNDLPLFLGIYPPLDAALRDGSFLFFILASIFTFLFIILNFDKKIIINNHITLLLISTFFIALVVFINIIFYPEICNAEFCSTEKILSSGFSMFIRFIILFLLIQIIQDVDIKKIIFYISLGLVFNFFYIIFELVDRVIPLYFGTPSFGIIDSIQPYLHDRVNYDMYRTRGLAFEPSFLALYLIFTLPFILSSNSKLLIGIWIVSLISSYSATAVMGFITFLTFYFNLIKNKFLILLLLFFLYFFIFFLIENFEEMISTITRIGSWVSSLYAIADNPFFGVGPSMSGYWIVQYYPDFFDLSFEANKWKNVAFYNFQAPTFASLFTFILDYGLLFFIFIFVYLYKYGYIKDVMRSRIGKASCLSLFVASFGMNTYAFWGYWIFLAITLARKWADLDFILLKTSSLQKNISDI